MAWEGAKLTSRVALWMRMCRARVPLQACDMAPRWPGVVPRLPQGWFQGRAYIGPNCFMTPRTLDGAKMASRMDPGMCSTGRMAPRWLEDGLKDGPWMCIYRPECIHRAARWLQGGPGWCQDCFKDGTKIAPR